MVNLNLGRDMPDCPLPWRNMITYLQNEPDTVVSDEIIAEELDKFSARLIYKKGYVVEFSSESDHLLWCLKWT